MTLLYADVTLCSGTVYDAHIGGGLIMEVCLPGRAGGCTIFHKSLRKVVYGSF